MNHSTFLKHVLEYYKDVIQTGFFLLNLVFLALGLKHQRVCFIPVAAGAIWLAKEHVEASQPILAAFFALIVTVFVYGYFNWQYLGKHINKMNKQDLLTTIFISFAVAIGIVGVMLYYKQPHPALNALVLALTFIVNLMVAKGIHDAWLLLTVLSTVTLLIAIPLALPLLAASSLFTGVASMYIFIVWSLDYYGSINFRIIE